MSKDPRSREIRSDKRENRPSIADVVPQHDVSAMSRSRFGILTAGVICFAIGAALSVIVSIVHPPGGSYTQGLEERTKALAVENQRLLDANRSAEEQLKTQTARTQTAEANVQKAKEDVQKANAQLATAQRNLRSVCKEFDAANRPRECDSP
jgi:uncharacterized protein YlxW (UPF0749 family)